MSLSGIATKAWKRLALLVVCFCALCAARCEVVVVVPENPTAVERFAASELAGELGKCLGVTPEVVREGELRSPWTATLPKRLFVGATQAAREAQKCRASARPDRLGKPPSRRREYETDEVFLQSVPGGVVLDGDPARAPIYAVDLYLEKYCGVRWWTSDAATYPKLDAAPVENISLSYAPQFKYRETYYLDDFDPLFKVRSKGNFTSRTRFLLSELKFVPPEMGGNHRLYFFEGRRSAYHSFFEILPPKIYFEKHPEWYSLVKGRRVAQQLCLANAEMKAEYIKETLRRLREDPSVDFIQVSQNDANRGWCECEKCRAMMDEDGGAPSGPYLRFANDVAEAVEKEFPDVRIDTFAYQFTRQAPAKTRPRRNVVVRLCASGSDLARALDDSSSLKNAPFAEALPKWREIADGRLFIWNYLANFKNYMLPLPNFSRVGRDIRFFAANGAVGVFEQGDALCRAGSFAPLMHYVASHLLWDSAEDDKHLTDEFLHGYYGESAAPHLKRFMDIVESAAKKSGKVAGLRYTSCHFLSAPAKLKAAAAMDDAVAAAGRDGPEFAERVKRERLSIDHVLLLHYDALREYAAKHSIPWRRPESRAEAVENWIREVKSLGVRAVRETTSAADIEKYFDTLRSGAAAGR